jgi:hypothetical protein
MSQPPLQPPPLPTLPPPLPAPVAAATPGQTLRRLFLTLFLRGRTSRGLRRETAPRSVGTKLAWTLVLYALMGLFALAFLRQPVFGLSVYLHAMTLVFLGMFVAASAGEVLFNKEEADILLHRPVTPKALLWAKIAVLVQVSLWLAGAFNLAGFCVGLGAPDGGWRFPLAHAASTVMEALFCTGCVVLVYQLCLRYFGRERLEGLMTTAQVFVAIAAVLGGQLAPRLVPHLGRHLTLGADCWWLGLVPPAWFAGFDAALAGGGTRATWALAAAGVTATAMVLWLAFGRLAGDYGAGLQALNEAAAPPPRRRAGRRWLETVVSAPPLRWWLREPVSRASFLLTSAYLARDRDVKLRVYPGLAPMLVMPVIFLLQGRAESGSFPVAFAGSFLGMIPLLGLDLLKYSQQWQAADLFRAAPLPGPAPLCHGARRAVLCFLALPLLVLFGALLWTLREASQLALLLPGLLAMPVYALVPSLGGKAIPLSQPTEEAKSASRGLVMIGVMLAAVVLSVLATWAWSGGWFGWLLGAELLVVAGLYTALRASLTARRWPPME